MRQYDTLDGLYCGLDVNLRAVEKVWDKDSQDTTPELSLQSLIQRATEQSGEKVAVLIDEYDKPLT